MNFRIFDVEIKGQDVDNYVEFIRKTSFVSVHLSAEDSPSLSSRSFSVTFSGGWMHGTYVRIELVHYSVVNIVQITSTFCVLALFI